MVKKPEKKVQAKSSKAPKAKGKTGSASPSKVAKSAVTKKSKPAPVAKKSAPKAKVVVSKPAKGKATPAKSVEKKAPAKPETASKTTKKEVVQPVSKSSPKVEKDKKTAAGAVVDFKVEKESKPVAEQKPTESTKVISEPAVAVQLPPEKEEVKPVVAKKPEKKPRDLAKILASKPLEGRNFIDEILSPVRLDHQEKDINVKTEMQKEVSETTKTARSAEEKRGISVEDKLRALYDLQLIDTRIDKIRAVRGELPLEVQDLEDEIAGLNTRITNYKEEMESIDREISGKKNAIKDAEALIKKYKEQQGKVRNNREFDSLTKETEYQELEIQLYKKKIKEFEGLKAVKTEMIDSAETKVAERNNDLRVKQSELNEIIAETEKEENFLQRKSKEAQEVIEQRLLDAYSRIREASRNGLAVVPIEREASAGSFITIPPQKQLDVAARKKIIVDEHSGRILVDADLAREETERIEGLLAQELAR